MENLFMKEFPVVVLKKKILLFVSSCVAIILFFLEPFSGEPHLSVRLFILALGYGVLTFAGLYVFNDVIKQKVHAYLHKWTVLYEMVFILFLILFITAVNSLFAALFTQSVFTGNMYLSWISVTLRLGIFPAIFIVLYIHHRSKLDKFVEVVEAEKEPQPQKKVTIADMASNKTLVISAEDFVYAEIRSCTLHIHFMHSNNLQERHVRTTISNVEKDICQKNIIRCHRSFIINTSYVDAMEGNSNGYKLYLKCCNDVIPVSRRYTLFIKQLIDQDSVFV